MAEALPQPNILTVAAGANPLNLSGPVISWTNRVAAYLGPTSSRQRESSDAPCHRGSLHRDSSESSSPSNTYTPDISLESALGISYQYCQIILLANVVFRGSGVFLVGLFEFGSGGECMRL